MVFENEKIVRRFKWINGEADGFGIVLDPDEQIEQGWSIGASFSREHGWVGVLWHVDGTWIDFGGGTKSFPEFELELVEEVERQGISLIG